MIIIIISWFNALEENESGTRLKKKKKKIDRVAT
jgi:hypothetical protein